MSISLSSSAFYSSHDFVRTLRSAPDPPVDGGPLKIEIAQEAWANPSFYVPSKAEVIADWILTKFLKDKGKEISENPIFDIRYWHLLLNLLVPQDFSPFTKNAILRPERAWLPPLLHRVPLGPIVVAFLASFHELNEVTRRDLADTVNACLSIFWPTAVQKIATETLQECFGALLSTHLFDSNGESLSKIGHIICNSYRTSLTTSSNKKKLYQAFLHAHLKAWIYCVQNVSDRSLRKVMHDAGVDTILNLDALRLDLDLKTETPLLEKLEALLSEERDLVLKTLPVLFASYVDALKKNRGALFGQGSQANSGSSLNQLHDSALRSFMAFSSLIDNSPRDHQAWTARLALLETIDRENIFSRDHIEGRLAFEQIINLALMCLDEGWEEESNCSDLVISCLSAISRIDYDLIQPSIPRILPRLLHIGVLSRPCLDFLDLLLSYHIKTRTLGTFVESLLMAISGANQTHMDSPKAYQLSFSSPLMHQIFLDRLSKALQKFLTESQSQATISLLVASLEKLWNLPYSDAHELDAERSESPKKKRKVDRLKDHNMEQSAVAYSLVCRLASLVLSSLPMHSLSEIASKTVRESIIAFRAEFISRAVSKAIKSIKKQPGPVVWSSEVALASTLRLLYALNTSRNLTISPHQDEKAVKKLMDLLKLDDLLPELKLEIFRILFHHLSCKGLIEKDEVISRFLQYLKEHFSTTDIHWSGRSHHLSKGETGRAELALALLHLIVERWLPEVDRLASVEQLKTFLQILMSIEVQRGSWLDQEIDPGTLLMRLFHSAQFWELKNIRTALLSLLDEMTARLSSDISVTTSSSSISKEVHVYRHLLLFPMEYFSWAMLDSLTTRSVAADIALTSLTVSEKSSVIEDLTVLRIFLKRAFAYANTASQDLFSYSSEFLVHLLKPPISSTKSTELIGATLELVEICMTRLLKASKKNGPKAMLDVLASIKPEAFCGPLDFSALAITSLAGLLERDFSPPRLVPVVPSSGSSSYFKCSLSEEIVAAVAGLLRNMQLSLTPVLESINGIDFSLPDQVQKCSDAISGWNTLLCLQRWLPQNEIPAPTFTIAGRNLLPILASWLKRANTAPTQECEKLCVDVFAVLLQELEMIPAVDHAQYMEVIISMYILLSSLLGDEGRRNINFHLARTCRKLAVPDYVHALSFISDSLSNNEHLSCHHLSFLVDLATLALRDHPTHSLVHVQKFATSCLSIFDNRPIFVQGPRDVRLKVLDMIAVHCANQQAALRLSDVASIWSLLSKYLAPSTIHDDETDAATYFKTVSIVGSLIRFRRDLVSHTLPHLSGILRQLISSLRACRPNLGGRQTALVMAGLPRWMNAKQPLGAEEARALGRLLETLTAKTVVRILGSATTEAQKAESLAKPFSKHAAYVLEAYIESMNDPLCVLPLEIRKELETGLFALCSMMSEHSRDSLMMSALDAGGKAILKALWKEYEKQRYVGKG